MAVINLKAEHPLFDETKEDAGIDYQGHGVGFLKKDLSEKLIYCDDLDREEVQELFNNQKEYYFGKISLSWEFTPDAVMGRGKVAMWFAKYFKNGYYEEPYE